MHNRDSFPGDVKMDFSQIPDVDQRIGGEITGRLVQQEYEGLDSGELAWILGRRFIHQTGEEERGFADIDDDDTGKLSAFRAFNTSAHGLGMGAGPDRMQRLAYTSWIEASFRARHGTKSINLSNLSLASDKGQYLSSVLRQYKPFIAGATALMAVDVPFVIEEKIGRDLPLPTMEQTGDDGRGIPAPANLHGGGFACGLFVMEKGPFLRGKMINSDPVDVVAPGCFTPNGAAPISDTLPRNLGDEIAFEALFAELRAHGMFDWTPDGMVLSKLESPSGEPMSNAELDARSGQLFNVAIQGPAVAKTWTGNPMMQCLPMDKVFVVMVADVHAKVLEGAGAEGAETVQSNEGQVEGLEAMDAYARWAKGGDNHAPPRPFDAEGWSEVKSLIQAAKQATPSDTAADPWGGAGHADRVKQRFEVYAAAATPGATAELGAAVTEQRLLMEQAFQYGNGSKEWANTAARLQRGTAGVQDCTMSNFRLMRVTSSFLSSYSYVEYENGAVKKGSRCGLRAGSNRPPSAEADAPLDRQLATGTEICSEFIIGGWCIGTVLDSAASRSTVGHQVRTAPASMAINVNVNIEWWSGDKLYKHYMDVDGTVHQRGQRPEQEDGAEDRERKTDVNRADRPEKVVWRERQVD